ncbi:TetR/AcrR family transcriptional regulator [Paenibacillus sp. CAU 1782]
MNEQNAKYINAEATKEALLRRAESLFAEFGFAKTSIDEIVKHEQLTKGAFYYHFKDKKTIFEQVVDRFLNEMVQQINRAIADKKDPWERAMTALNMYLEGCLQQSYRQIVLQEGPVTLGWKQWREKEKRSVMSVSALLLQELMESGHISTQPSGLLADILFGAVTEAAIGIAEADDPVAARTQVGSILETMLRSF